jgi:hypothetical protein
MNPNEQRIAIAKACGKGRAIAAAELSHRSLDEYDIPDYLNDLNAMHDAEEVLTEAQSKKYLHFLAQPASHPQEIYYNEAFSLVTATAAQRAEAFLRTLNLWKE